MNELRPVHTLVAAAAAVALLSFGVQQAPAAAVPLNPATLTKYLDPLPIPPVAQPTAPNYYELHMMQGTATMHSQLPPTTVWGYGGGYLGPTIVARTGQPIDVRWFNDLPFTHIFAGSIDYTLDGMLDEDGNPLPESRAVTHLHGGHVEEASDGNADQWFVPGDSKLDHYPNDQQASFLWYHDHALGTTRLNPYAGLAGVYVVRDDYEDGLNLPGGPSDEPGVNGSYSVPLVIQDKSFTVDPTAGTSALWYPTTGALPSVHPQWVPEFFGDTIVVNGKIWPYLNVEPRKYRLRIINGSNARFYSLSLAPPSGGTVRTLSQIGSDGGLLPALAPTNQLLIAPGERADVIVDFSKSAGTTLLLRNSAKVPYPAGKAPDPKTVGQIMQFRVGTTLSHPDNTTIPATPRPITRFTAADAAQTRDVKMTEVLDPATGIPTKLQLEDMGWMDRPITLTPEVGTTELWQFINTTGDTHPMHLHLVQFQVLNRQKFNVSKYLANGNVLAPTLVGKARAPEANEMGWKDTVQVAPGEVVRIMATFTNLGMFPVHCHILEHEENDMMRPFQVVP